MPSTPGSSQVDMEQADSTKPAVPVTDLTAVRLPLDAERLRFLRPFMLGERSTSAAAAESRASLIHMAHRVRRVHARGLLPCTRERRRAGRPVRLYRAAPPSAYPSRPCRRPPRWRRSRSCYAARGRSPSTGRCRRWPRPNGTCTAGAGDSRSMRPSASPYARRSTPAATCRCSNVCKMRPARHCTWRAFP